MRKRVINLTLYECWKVIFFTFTTFYYDYNLHSCYKAVEEWCSWTLRQISIGYPLITGDLYPPIRLTMQCVASVLPNYVSREMRALALRQRPNALRISSTAAGLNVGVHWSNKHAHLIKCACWSNAPYVSTFFTKLKRSCLTVDITDTIDSYRLYTT